MAAQSIAKMMIFRLFDPFLSLSHPSPTPNPSEIMFKTCLHTSYNTPGYRADPVFGLYHLSMLIYTEKMAFFDEKSTFFSFFSKKMHQKSRYWGCSAEFLQKMCRFFTEKLHFFYRKCTFSVKKITENVHFL